MPSTLWGPYITVSWEKDLHISMSLSYIVWESFTQHFYLLLLPGVTVTKETKPGDSQKLPRAGPEIDKLRSNAEKKQQEVRESHMRVHKAQQKTRDLALNIR